MSSCKSCLVNIKKNHIKLSCGSCGSDFHAKCVKMTPADVDFLKEQNSEWRCEPCSTERRKSMRLECSAEAGSLTLQDIMQVLNEIREDQKRTVCDINKSYEQLNDRLNEWTVTLQTEIRKMEENMKKFSDLETENITLKKTVQSLESRVEDLEQYSRRNCVELQGIPETKEESVTEIVKQVGNVLGMELTETMMDACHRLGKKNEERGPRAIIVKFVRRIDKETFMKRRREKRDLSTRHMGLPTDTPVYVNESLSPSRRRLLGQVRRLRKERGYKYLWLRGGSILLRKEEGSPVIEVKCQADLNIL